MNYWMLRLARPTCVKERSPPIIPGKFGTLSLRELQIEQVFCGLFLRKRKAYSNKGSKATDCSKKKMAVIVFEMFLPFPAKCCVDSCAIQAWPSPLPPSWLCVHFSYVWDSRSVNKGAWRQRLPLGCKHPSVSGVWKQPSRPWEEVFP